MNRKITAVVAVTALTSASFALMLHFRPEKKTQQPLVIPASTESERTAYFASHGWEVREISCSDILIPAVFSEKYSEYA